MFILGCIFFNISINDLEEKTECTSSALQVTLNCRRIRGRAVGTLEGRAAIQKDLDRLEKQPGLTTTL